jgi:YidC/Oxa1 family membrane protein insertase
MNQHRYIFMLVFIASGLLLFGTWQREKSQAELMAAKKSAQTLPSSVPSAAPPTATPSSIPSPSTTAAATSSVPAMPATTTVGSGFSGERTRIETDKYIAYVNTLGGVLESLELKEHKDSQDKSKLFQYLQNTSKHLHVAQTGLIGSNLPNHTTLYRATLKKSGSNDDQILTLTPASAGLPEVSVTREWIFHPNSYVIDSNVIVNNQATLPWTASAYFQIERDNLLPAGQPKVISSFNGVAIYNDEDKYVKVSFDDIAKNKASFNKKPTSGWIGMSEHYFVSAWLATPASHLNIAEFYAHSSETNRFDAGMIINQTIQPKQQGKISVPLYVGPQEQEKMATIAPGLELTVDYGMFTIFAVPLFRFLKLIHQFIGNWGWSILLMTLIIKGVFYPLNKSSAYTMAKTKLLAPRMEQLKTIYKDDPVKMQTEIINLYKQEKVNPAGGCLPVLAQMPVFIALYWVLLSAVELRNAPWLGWIHDLSAADPYFILPAVYMVTSFLQIHMNPSPAKGNNKAEEMIMKYMPLMFSAMFFFFPAGMLLYWILSNVLGVLQQWHVNRVLERSGLGKTSFLPASNG